jgi:hypothetical protein
MAKNLSHEQALRLASLQLDQPLAESESEMLAAHLHGCGACQRAAHEMGLVANLMRREQAIHTPPGLVARAIQFHGGKVRREREVEESGAHVLRVIRWGAVAAGLVLLITSFFAFGGPTGGLHRSELKAANESLLDRVLVSERRQPQSGAEIIWQMLANRRGTRR